MSNFDYDSHGGGVEMFGSIYAGEKGDLVWIDNRLVYGQIQVDNLPMHGSPQDRGSADRYYGRFYDPHFWPAGTSHGRKVITSEMTEDEIAAYKYGWDNENDRKDWG